MLLGHKAYAGLGCSVHLFARGVHSIKISKHATIVDGSLENDEGEMEGQWRLSRESGSESESDGSEREREREGVKEREWERGSERGREGERENR